MIHVGETISNTTTGEQITFLQTAAGSAGALLAFESFLPAGVAGPPLHTHPRQEERFSVIAGTLHLVMNGAARNLHAGETLIIPPGTPHLFDNRHGDDVRFRVELSPALESEQLFAGVLRAANRRGATSANLIEIAMILDRFDIGLALAGVPPRLQRGLMAMLARLGQLWGYQLDASKPVALR